MESLITKVISNIEEQIKNQSLQEDINRLKDTVRLYEDTSQRLIGIFCRENREKQDEINKLHDLNIRLNESLKEKDETIANLTNKQEKLENIVQGFQDRLQNLEQNSLTEKTGTKRKKRENKQNSKKKRT